MENENLYKKLSKRLDDLEKFPKLKQNKSISKTASVVSKTAFDNDVLNNSVYNWNSNISEPIWGDYSKTTDDKTEQTSVYLVSRLSLTDSLT